MAKKNTIDEQVSAFLTARTREIMVSSAMKIGVAEALKTAKAEAIPLRAKLELEALDATIAAAILRDAKAERKAVKEARIQNYEPMPSELVTLILSDHKAFKETGTPMRDFIALRLASYGTAMKASPETTARLCKVYGIA